MSEKRKIYKYEIPLSDGRVQLKLPGNAKILSVGTQDGGIFLWAIVSPWVEDRTRFFQIFGTGQELPYDIDVKSGDCEFIGTVILQGDIYARLVFHVFEVDKK